jgi:hypothetical protein
MVESELHRLAARYIGRERAGHLLQRELHYGYDDPLESADVV